jgi:hypothetical protein
MEQVGGTGSLSSYASHAALEATGHSGCFMVGAGLYRVACAAAWAFAFVLWQAAARYKAD